MAERVKGISTHVLDSSCGTPAPGVPVKLEVRHDMLWTIVSQDETDLDGRCSELLAGRPLSPGTYRITFETARYFEARGLVFLYPEVVISFVIRDTTSHYHIPLLLGPNTYTTYRGS